MDPETRAKVMAVIQVLNTVDVRGKSNMKALSGCIEFLESLTEIQNGPEKEAKK